MIAIILLTSKWLTFGWGVIAIIFAFLANSSENLIEAVNIIGSIFYGTILGIFLVAFFVKYVRGSAVFYAALVAQTVVITFHVLTMLDVITLGYLMVQCHRYGNYHLAEYFFQSLTGKQRA